MSNQAAALVVLPVAIQTAIALGLNPRTFIVGVTYAASFSFITPLEPACVLGLYTWPISVYGLRQDRDRTDHYCVHSLDDPRAGLLAASVTSPK
jgi:hypothetical protein